MKSRIKWWAGMIVAMGGVVLGCTSSGKSAGSSAAGIKRSDQSLRTATERDPFSWAPGMATSGKSSTAK